MFEVHQEELEVINLVGKLLILFRNYGPTIQVSNEAAKKGHQQVLWLFNKKVGEVGSSNIFFVLTDKKTGKKSVITP
jgi:branched-subunit amino acid aminotransferase/4-amino-4-deoxychorismate lyase